MFFHVVKPLFGSLEAVFLAVAAGYHAVSDLAVGVGLDKYQIVEIVFFDFNKVCGVYNNAETYGLNQLGMAFVGHIATPRGTYTIGLDEALVVALEFLYTGAEYVAGLIAFELDSDKEIAAVGGYAVALGHLYRMAVVEPVFVNHFYSVVIDNCLGARSHGIDRDGSSVLIAAE